MIMAHGDNISVSEWSSEAAPLITQNMVGSALISRSSDIHFAAEPGDVVKARDTYVTLDLHTLVQFIYTGGPIELHLRAATSRLVKQLDYSLHEKVRKYSVIKESDSIEGLFGEVCLHLENDLLACQDCKGTGKYIGFSFIETCSKCNGTKINNSLASGYSFVIPPEIELKFLRSKIYSGATMPPDSYSGNKDHYLCNYAGFDIIMDFETIYDINHNIIEPATASVYHKDSMVLVTRRSKTSQDCIKTNDIIIGCHTKEILAKDADSFSDIASNELVTQVTLEILGGIGILDKSKMCRASISPQ